MMTLQLWRTNTTRFMSDRKNPLILDIDILLAEYYTTGKTDVQKQKILILMLYYCTQWLVTKGEKASSWRRPYVQALVNDIEMELRSPSMMQATTQRTGGPGVQLKEDPIEVLQPRSGAKFGLQSDLNFNRSSAARAGNFVTDFGQKRANRNSNNAYVAGLANSPINDYVDSLKILAAGNAAGQVKVNLQYLSKGERLRCQLSLWPDQLFHHGGADNPYSTTMNTDANHVRDKDLYAMDQMELIYTKAKGANGVLHHSSFTSGKAVLCAGEIRLDNGIISYISNESGHYMPSTQDLLNCVQVLQRKYGVNLRGVKVGDLKTKQEWDSASQFLACRGTRRFGTARQ